MYLQIFVIFATLQFTIAEHPVIFQEDDTVIATEPVKISFPQERQFVPAQYPFYEVITKNSAVPAPPPKPSNSAEFPDDLVEIATTKLNITNLNQIPSISELGDLLGTTSREETIETLRQLATTEIGIDLIKAFIEASNYIEQTEDKEPEETNEAEPSEELQSKSLLSETAEKNLEILKKVVTTPRPELGFFQRVTSYFNFFDLFPENQEIPYSPVSQEVQELQPRSHNKHHDNHHKPNPKFRSVLLPQNYPDSYPKPILPGPVSASGSLSFQRPHHLVKGNHINNENELN